MGGHNLINAGVKRGEAVFERRTPSLERRNSFTEGIIRLGRSGSWRRDRWWYRGGGTGHDTATSTAVPHVDTRLLTSGTLPARRVRWRWKLGFGGGGRRRPERTLTGLMGGSTPGTLGGGRTVPGYMANTPAPITPGAVVVEPPHLTRRQKREEIKRDGVRRRVRETPHNNDAVDRGAVLNEAPRRIDSRVLLSEAMVHIHWVTGENKLGVLTWPHGGVLRDERQRQEFTRRNAFQDV